MITNNTSVDVMKNIKYIVPVFCIFMLQFIHIKAQDSLYLVGTITGESLEKRITNVAGVGDVNGDGYGDFLIAMSEDNTVHMYFGSPDLNLEPDVVFTPHSSMSMISNFGLAISGIGDVNGDGYADFAIAAHFHDWEFFKEIVFLYYGGETISTTPVAEFYEPWIQDGFGHLIMDVGDINKDGYNDFTISSSYNWTNGKGRVYLFWGGDTISFERSVTFLDTAAIDTLIDSFFGESVANIGDINGDGFDDIAISVGYDPSVLSEKVYVYYGNDLMNATPDTILSSADINGDGYDDLFILAPNYPNYENPLGKIYIYSYRNISNVKDYGEELPGTFEVYQNYPNPFNPTTIIRWQSEASAYTSIRVFDILGRDIAVLHDEYTPAGSHIIEFDASRYNLGTGIYFCELKIKGGGSFRIKMVYLR